MEREREETAYPKIVHELPGGGGHAAKPNKNGGKRGGGPEGNADEQSAEDFVITRKEPLQQ